MNRENDTNTQDKEHTFRSSKEPLPIISKADNELKSDDPQNNAVKVDKLSNDNSNLDDHTAIPDDTYIYITVWRDRKLCITKPLIPQRIAMIFWFASGSLCLPFFSLLLTDKGLRLTEFSYVFSILFLFQLAVSYTFGIIADKLGNAKPVLLFSMLSTVFVLICLLLCPEVRDKSCLEHNINFACFEALNYTTGLENCEGACSINTLKYIISDDENGNKNESFMFRKVISTLNHNRTSDVVLSSNAFCRNICLCLEQHAKKCALTSKVGLKILYSVLIVSFFSFWSTSSSFLDFSSLNLAKKYNSHFGKERFFGIFGALVSTFLCNFVLKIDNSASLGYYDNVFWFAVALYTVSVVSASKTSVVEIPLGLNFTKKTLELLRNMEIMSVICLTFVGGTSSTFNNFFHLWFLDSLKASKTLISLHAMSNPLYILPMCLTSKWWLEKLGTKKIFIICLLCSALNGICYSFLYNPWFSLLIQLTRPFSQLFYLTVIVHCREIAPEGFASTLNAVVGTIFSGIGRSFSVSVGGYLISSFGARITFRMLAGFCFITVIFYLTYLYLRILFLKKTTKCEVRIQKKSEV